MKKQAVQNPEDQSELSQSKRMTKKDQIISLYTSGIDNLEDIALMTGTRPGYAASVLQAAGLIAGYFDLYTTTSHPMNTYSRFFANKLGFKNEAAAQQSVGLINRLYKQFEMARDRAGQHHALLMALTMYNRARWTGKQLEADFFRQWLVERLSEPAPEVIPASESTEEEDQPEHELSEFTQSPPDSFGQTETGQQVHH
jgi:hypothetical protein